MRKLFAIMLIAATAAANEMSFRSLQSGPGGETTPISNHGLHGEGQIIAVLDTGVDPQNCYFAETDNSLPPANTNFEWRNIDLSRRKIIAYDYLYSCDQYPGAFGCERPNVLADYDNTGHGTHAAAAAVGDVAPFVTHNFLDALASAAKLVVQDGGFIGGDGCSQRPGFGCPVNLTPIFDQAYKQGARIHSNSWGDISAATASYSAATRDVDAFVVSHPDMVIVFNTGNYGATADPPPTPAPAYSVATPGDAKNTIQVGGTRPPGRSDDVLTYNTLFGPTRDGRIKPDVVGPSTVIAGDSTLGRGPGCLISTQGPGTSWASPTIAGAAAVVRQYYTDGYYPTGAARQSDRFNPTAALVKATIIASARQVPYRSTINGDVPALPVPSYEQGFGFPVLDDALYFPGDTSKLRVVESDLAQGGSATIKVTAASTLKAVLVWTDPAGSTLVNDLDLTITDPNGTPHYGNESLHPGHADTVNNVEAVSLQATGGVYNITVSGSRVTSRQAYALVITGDIATPAVRTRAVRH